MKRLLLMLIMIMILGLTACGQKEPVIGVEHPQVSSLLETALILRYFESKKEAVKFYRDKGVTNYVLMTHPEKHEKTIYDQLDLEEQNDGKLIRFQSEEDGQSAEDLSLDFLFEELGLGTECAFDGKECK